MFLLPHSGPLLAHHPLAIRPSRGAPLAHLSSRDRTYHQAKLGCSGPLFGPPMSCVLADHICLFKLMGSRTDGWQLMYKAQWTSGHVGLTLLTPVFQRCHGTVKPDIWSSFSLLRALWLSSNAETLVWRAVSRLRCRSLHMFLLCFSFLLHCAGIHPSQHTELVYASNKTVRNWFVYTDENVSCWSTIKRRWYWPQVVVGQ